MQLSSFCWWETHKTFHQRTRKNALMEMHHLTGLNSLSLLKELPILFRLSLVLFPGSQGRKISTPNFATRTKLH